MKQRWSKGRAGTRPRVGRWTGLLLGLGRAVHVRWLDLQSPREILVVLLDCLEILGFGSPVGWDVHSDVGVLFKWETWIQLSVPWRWLAQGLFYHLTRPSHQGWGASSWEGLLVDRPSRWEIMPLPTFISWDLPWKGCSSSWELLWRAFQFFTVTRKVSFQLFRLNSRTSFFLGPVNNLLHPISAF